MFRTDPKIEARILKAGRTNITKVTFDENAYIRQQQQQTSSDDDS